MSARSLWVILIVVLSLLLSAGIGLTATTTASTAATTPAAKPESADYPIDIAVSAEGATEIRSLETGRSILSAPVSVLMSQDFEGVWPATGWELSDMSDADGGEYLWGKRDCHPHAGTYGGWAVGGGAKGNTLACAGSYPNNARSWAVYGPFDLRNATSASVTFHLWGRTEYEADCSYDFLFAGSSIDGDQFSGRRYCGDWTTGSDGNGYSQRTIDLTARLGQSQVWIGFAFSSDNDTTASGITIDDVSLNVSGGTLPTSTATPTGGTPPTSTPTPTSTLTPTSTPTPTGGTPPTSTPTPTITPTPTSPRQQAQHAAVRLPLVMHHFPPPPTATPTPPPPHWQWQHGSQYFFGVHFINPDLGWAVGEWGLIVRSDDGGRTWMRQESGTTADLNAVQFVDANEGWAIGDGGTILHTINGGTSWYAQSSPYKVDLTVMWFVDAQHGWIGLSDGVLKTTNGGATWVKTGSGIPAQVNDIQFLDANNGALVTLSGLDGRGIIKITSDGGETWGATGCKASYMFEKCDKVWALHFPSPEFGYAVGGFVDSIGYVSTDRGTTWNAGGPNEDFMEPKEIYFADVSNGWAAAWSSYLRTSNGGNTWSSFNGPSASDIQLLTSNVGFVAGYDGVSKTVDGGYNFSRSDVFSQSSLVAVSFANAAAGWAVGSGEIWHTANGGENWNLQRSDTSSLKAIDSANPERAWAVGNSGKILATTNGGTTWFAQTASTTTICLM